MGDVILRYRLRMSTFTRVMRTAVLASIGVLFIPALFGAGVELSWRLLSIVGLASSVYGLRIVLGPAVEVRPEGLRLMKNWPRKRDIAWYRILEVEVIPGYWTLDLELNSGERIELPCVENVDDLYEHIEELRQSLDA